MPARLDELSNLSIINPRVENSSDILSQRYANAPKVPDIYQNWTVIEDVTSCQTALPHGTMSQYPMDPYNSNYIIPAYSNSVCPSSTTQYIQYAQQSHPNQTQMYDSYSGMVIEMPRQAAFQNSIDSYLNQTPAQYAIQFQNPPFAGSVPYMKDAAYYDASIPMKDSYTNTTSILPPPFPIQYVQSVPQPAPQQPVPQPAQQPAQQPTPQPVTQPTPQPVTQQQSDQQASLGDIITKQGKKEYFAMDCSECAKRGNMKFYIIIGILILLLLFCIIYIIMMKRKPISLIPKLYY